MLQSVKCTNTWKSYTVRATLASASRRYASSHSYQTTLNLPRTKFSPRSNIQKTYNELIPQSSQVLYKVQLDEFFKRYNEIDSNDMDQKLNFIKENLFILHDGPPYANGDLHLGHALNKILKDIINRYQLSQGKYIYYRPGWDCHGLPIELKALKKLNSEEIEHISPIRIRNIASKHALATQKKQRSQFEKFGILTDWSHPYITMDKDYEINQLKIFKKLFEYGLIKRQNKPVYWGTETRTALAEGELEYNENHKSVSAYVKFPLTKESLGLLQQRLMTEPLESVDCLIWTSTPWTLFSNQAICYNERMNYSLLKLETSGNFIIVGTDLIEKLNFPESYKIIVSFEGTQLKGLYYTNSLFDTNSNNNSKPLLESSHVTNTAGTGLVHTAPGHGQDDYLVGMKNNLAIFSPIDYKGNYDLSKFSNVSNVQLFLKDPNSASGEGRNVLDPNTTTAIIDKLKDLGVLMNTETITHSYPYDWRSKKPIIIRSTQQWFTNLKNLKNIAVESIKNVNFYPKRGQHRLTSFVQNRNEWCISRQRSWGIPIPYFEHRENPDIILMDEEIISLAITNIQKWGMDSWFLEEDPNNEKTNIKNWLPVKYQDVAHEYKKGRDTMDVWFDSGSSWSTLKDFYSEKLGIPEVNQPNPLANIYLEGSDQHRGWFQSSLLCRVAYTEKPTAPYGTVITHGFTLDEKGIKMSKSIGNTIAPKEIIEGNKEMNLPALGVDGLRYLVAQSDFTSDITVGSTVMQHTSDALKKIRLCFKFLLGNLQKSSNYELVPFNQLEPVDKYVISKLQQLLDDSKKNYTEYNFSKVLVNLQFHLNNELSGFYFDTSKDILYSNNVNSLRRQQIQTTLYDILNAYCAILTPILPITVQDVENYISSDWVKNNKSNRDINVQSFKPWPNFVQQLAQSKSITQSFEKNELKILSTFKKEFSKLTDSTITKPGQTVAKIYTTDDVPFDTNSLIELLQTADVEIKKVDSLTNVQENNTQIDGTNYAIQVGVSKMHKCPRCWKHSSVADDTLISINENANDPTKKVTYQNEQIIKLIKKSKMLSKLQADPRFSHYFKRITTSGTIPMITSFFILHELTAILPLFTVWYILYNLNMMENMEFSGELMTKCSNAIERLVGDKYQEFDKHRLILSGALSYALQNEMKEVRGGRNNQNDMNMYQQYDRRLTQDLNSNNQVQPNVVSRNLYQNYSQNHHSSSQRNHIMNKQTSGTVHGKTPMLMANNDVFSIVPYRMRKDRQRISVLKKYEIIGYIAAGTYGKVYKAKSLTLPTSPQGGPIMGAPNGKPSQSIIPNINDNSLNSNFTNKQNPSTSKLGTNNKSSRDASESNPLNGNTNGSVPHTISESKSVGSTTKQMDSLENEDLTNKKVNEAIQRNIIPNTMGNESDSNNNVEMGSMSMSMHSPTKKKNIPIYYAIKKFKAEKEGVEQLHYTGISQSACREMALCRELTNVHLTRLTEIFLERKSIYLVYEYAEHDLLQIIHYHSHPEKRMIPARMVRSIMWQILDGVSYLHQNWILHRDLKPANIMVTVDGCVKIGDLGLARKFSNMLQTLYTGDKVVVTIWYRAPELLLGARHYTPSIDVWAVGCIFAELIGLQPIFKGEETKMDSKKSVPFQSNQLQRILEVLGSPTPKTWSNLHKYPEDKNVLELLYKLLEYDPIKRIDAIDALDHNYFTNGDYPVCDSVFEGLNYKYPARRIHTNDSDIMNLGIHRSKNLNPQQQAVVNNSAANTLGGLGVNRRILAAAAAAAAAVTGSNSQGNSRYQEPSRKKRR
ncbi:isoleucine-tRNA ligase [Maudiozyma exigua]|uniref:Isoleucine--tRNA ligase, mitochondrial n=1 Tax=Maudiozyma exigua TaxID=34358 RepID=A0A9P6WA95_MAUEX|nr:isoleucine-tRNA ligase [Kazachstania exigua]